MKTFALVFLTACSAPFTMATADPPADDAGAVEAQATGDAVVLLDASPTPDATPDATPDTFKVEHDAGHPMPDAGPEPSPEPSPEPTPEAGPPAYDGGPLLPFRCVSPSGYVACDSGGGWSVRWGAQTCDASHPATVGCVQGAACEFFQTNGTVYAGTCQP